MKKHIGSFCWFTAVLSAFVFCAVNFVNGFDFANVINIINNAPEVAVVSADTKLEVNEKNEIAPTPEPQSTAQANPAPIKLDLKGKNRGQVISQTYTAAMGGNLVDVGGSFIRNYTDVSNESVSVFAAKKFKFAGKDISKPKVLIYHSHATESFAEKDAGDYDKTAPTRSSDNEMNTIAIGNEIAKQLEKAGIGVIHDKEHHDFPSYDKAYESSRKTINKYLKKYPSIEITLDVHRDAIESSDGTRYKAVTEINGKKAAQIMIITGCAGDDFPFKDWKKNLSFAAKLQRQMDADYKDLARPVMLDYRRYNMDVTPKSLLLEVGTHANSIDEVKYSGELCGLALVKVVKGL